MASISRCECGCGTVIPATSKRGTPQRYAHGHNARQLRFTVEDRGFETACWIFSNGGSGYGRLRRDGRQYQAHRWMWEQENGPIPHGLTLDHLCGVLRCINPAHLEPVSITENIRRGSRTKINAEQVREIRQAHRDALANAAPLRGGKKRQRVPGGVALREELGQRYGITPDMVKHIWAGTSWR